jgi:hypothetical protein
MFTAALLVLIFPVHHQVEALAPFLFLHMATAALSVLFFPVPH